MASRLLVRAVALPPGGPDQRFLRQSGLPGEPQPSLLVDREQLHADDVALLDDVLRLVRATLLELADVAESLGARHDLDERAEGRRVLDRALVDPTDLGVLHDR